MNRKWIVIATIVIVTAAAVFGLSEGPHEFMAGDCNLCHIDEKNEPMKIKSSVTPACEKCHLNAKEIQSHPVDMHPALSIPRDMLLIDGIFTCVTCHYVHPKKKRSFVKNKFFLRRGIRGPLFCNICHEINEKGHIVLENVHPGTYTVTDRTTRIDRISLECIECHDKHFKGAQDFPGTGSWEHLSNKSHPIGVSYDEASMKRSRDYRSKNMISKELMLFDGKVGCGTCHNIYSDLKNMLVMDNTGSRLCFECHIK